MSELSIQELHSKILYPCVRCRTEKAGGSGTIVYSRPNPKCADEYESFVLTNEHVIDSCIEIKERFDPVLKRDKKTEFFTKIQVDVFDYVNDSTVVSANTHSADIVAYDKEHDIALLKLNTPKIMRNVATLLPKTEIPNVKLFTPIFVCGASLLHEPFANPGMITFLHEQIENKDFMMGNASSIFGNSGGAVFLQSTGEFIGIPARVTTMQMGFGVDVVTWMSFFIPISRIYDFLEEQELQFLYDNSCTFESCMKRRKDLQNKTIAELASKGDKAK